MCMIKTFMGGKGGGWGGGGSSEGCLKWGGGVVIKGSFKKHLFTTFSSKETLHQGLTVKNLRTL